MIDFVQNMHSSLLEPERFPIAMMALVLAAVIGMITGPMHGNANPFLWGVGNKILGAMGQRLDRKERTKRNLVTRSLIFTIIALVFTFLIGSLAYNLTEIYPFYRITEIILLCLALTGGTVWYGLLRLYFALRDNKLTKNAYYTIATSTRTNMAGADDFAITRTAMGFAARSFDKGIVAPVFWYLLAGLPGAYLYAILGMLAWRFGKDGYSKGFGALPLALEKLMGFAPTFLAGLIIALAGLFTPTGGMTRAFIGLLQEEGRATYEEGGLPVTAMAYALDISLGGPVQDLDGSTLKRKWVGPKTASAKLEKGHLRRATYIIFMAYLLFIASLMSAMLFAG